MSPTWLGIIASLVWTITIAVVVGYSSPCDDAYNPVERYISCRPINEVGDFLAGAFAPLAFVWLMVAVFIQGKELSLTREEMKLTREVLHEQRNEASRSAEFLKQQTEEIKREAADSRMQHLVELIHMQILNIASSVQVEWRGEQYIIFSQHREGLMDQDLLLNIRRGASEIGGFVRESAESYTVHGMVSLDELYTNLTYLDSLLTSCSPAQAARYVTLGFAQLSQAIEELFEAQRVTLTAHSEHSTTASMLQE